MGTRKLRGDYDRVDALKFAMSVQRRLYYMRGQKAKDLATRKRLYKAHKKYVEKMYEHLLISEKARAVAFRKALQVKDPYGKYNNRKIERNGIVFDSIREADRYSFLRNREQKGEIQGLRCHVRFPLVDYRTGEHLRVSGPKVKRKCFYTCDFYYYVTAGMMEVIEDVKSSFTAKSPYFRFRKAAFEYLTGKRIRVVYHRETVPGSSIF